MLVHVVELSVPFISLSGEPRGSICTYLQVHVAGSLRHVAPACMRRKISWGCAHGSASNDECCPHPQADWKGLGPLDWHRRWSWNDDARTRRGCRSGSSTDEVGDDGALTTAW